MFNRVGLIGKRGDDRVAATLGRLVDFLRARGVDMVFDADSARTLPAFGLPVEDRDTLGADCDLVVVVAGDGTFLSAARDLCRHEVPLVGVNLGRLGFLSDIMPDEMTERLEEIFSGRFVEERRFLVRTTTVRDGEPVCEVNAFNEAVIHKWDNARLIRFETFIDARLVNSQRSDGLIVATPTGSTAYALSGGGPILHPGLDALVIVPICPHTLSSRPLVVHGSSRIEIRIGDGEDPEAQLACDGASLLPLSPGDRVIMQKRPEPIRLIHPAGHDYFATLRAKLHWSREL